MDPKIREVISLSFPDYKHIRFEWNSLRETFIFEQYKFLVQDVRPGTLAIDFGAGIGESSIYLARNPNVSKVIGFEPGKHNYGVALQNVKDAGFSSKIKLINQRASWPEMKGHVIVKSDCEGAEHELFRSDTDLSKVYKLQIEYHHGVKNLQKVLEDKGFVVETRKTSETVLQGKVGWIYAKRRQ